MSDRTPPPGEPVPAVGRLERAFGRFSAQPSRVTEWFTRPWSLVHSAWQRSIQLRVIVATLALSVVVASLLGITLSRQITDGLLSAQADAAMSDATAGLDTAQRRLDAAVDQGSGVSSQVLRQIAEDAAARGSISGSDPLYEIVLLGSARGSLFTSRPTFDSVPDALREQVSSEARLFRTYTSITYSDGSSTPGLAVGGQLVDPANNTTYELYYLFPLTEQQHTIDLVHRALTTAGVLLVLLLGALAWLVTRQVVTPVRLAARIAERFSAGHLSERMAVHGRDDLARLALSFNQMAASLEHQIGQLEELSRVQQRFVSDVSHELRTPLTTVRMAADVLYESRDEFDMMAQRSIELLQTQLDRFEALLADLLEISRFDAGAAVLGAERHDMRDLVHKVVEATAPLAAERGSEIVVNLPAQPCVAEVDARRIERVLRNLVSNAIEHGEGREVRVSAAGDDHAVAVTVRDYGVGLKPGESSLVFHRFWRADPARARTTGGTGLGLAIALEDARLHGGWLEAWGEPGEGAQFRLTVPRRSTEELRSSPLPLVPADAEPGPTDDPPSAESAAESSDAPGSAGTDPSAESAAESSDAPGSAGTDPSASPAGSQPADSPEVTHHG